MAQVWPNMACNGSANDISLPSLGKSQGQQKTQRRSSHPTRQTSPGRQLIKGRSPGKCQQTITDRCATQQQQQQHVTCNDVLGASDAGAISLPGRRTKFKPFQ